MRRLQLAYGLAVSAGLAAILAAASSSAAGKLQVKVDKMTFTPAKITAHVGDTITFDNADFLLHTATAKDKQFDLTLPVGKSASATLSKAGHIDYYCKMHPNMAGEIDVLPAK